MKKKLIVMLVLAVVAAATFAGVALALDGTHIYGMDRYTGDVYEINPETGVMWWSHNSTFATETAISPNGLAYDFENSRLYYCSYWGPTNLYYWDGVTGSNDVPVGTLTGDVAAATWANGKYYYIEGGGNTGRTDNFYEVTINPLTGLMVGAPTKLADLTGNVGDIPGTAQHVWYFDGDIAYNEDDNTIYCWGSYAKDTYEFFRIALDELSDLDPTTTGYHPIRDLGAEFGGATPGQDMQLAFANHYLTGEKYLYGHRAQDYTNGAFYRVDMATGTATFTAAWQPSGVSPNDLVLTFTDLASGPNGSGGSALISGTKWNDINRDAVFDLAEPGLPNWTITLYKWSDGGWVQQGDPQPTDGSGGYSFTINTPGEYKVQESQEDGWESTYPTNDLDDNYYLLHVADAPGPSLEITAEDSNGKSYNPSLPLDFGNVKAYPCGAGVYPTSTTACMFRNGTPTFQEYYATVDLTYQVQDPKGKINGVSPGVFFYYAWVYSDGVNDIVVQQTRLDYDGNPTTSLPIITALHEQIYLYKVVDDECLRMRGLDVNPYADGHIVISGAPEGAYILGIKYAASQTLANLFLDNPCDRPWVKYVFTVDDRVPCTEASLIVRYNGDVRPISPVNTQHVGDSTPAKGGKKPYNP